MAQSRETVSARSAKPSTHGEVPGAPGVVDERGMRTYGEALGAALRAPALVALRGPLGAGKTTLAQAIARGAGVRGEVTSPTFSLVHQYVTRSGLVYHVDLFRLENEEELTNLDWDGIVSSDAIVLVEWPERAGARLPVPRLDIVLSEQTGRDDVRVVSAEWTL
ncbi:MAG TPA: tRNA (adenosine(37)-N6)-threonylcarbamoyltransferase complex ATPase subunit type 1 TsaE [Gemmatimonadaceae bacterium]|nr:tRNA (adenosine(37)-N6)-threonylcarbamoyltransferase complex ATPase subunit type 1 TsaE [Gemmatimonadaceae bacterium]